MKNFIIFTLYFLLGFFLIFSFKKVSRILNSQQLKTPIAQSLFSLDTAPSESLKGTIVSLLGEVDWQSRIATEPAKINKPMQIQQGEKIVTKEKSQAAVTFSDIININIYPKTEINFIQTLPRDILIEQTSGKSEYEKLNNNSISIRSLGLLTKINQGKIIVTINETRPYVSVDVKDGSVTIGYNDLNFATQVLEVKSQKRIIFQTDTKEISLIPLQ